VKRKSRPLSHQISNVKKEKLLDKAEFFQTFVLIRTLVGNFFIENRGELLVFGKNRIKLFKNNNFGKTPISS